MSNLAKAHTFSGGAEYPSPYKQVAKLYDAFSLDVFRLLALDCVSPMSFETELLWATLCPVALLVGVGLFRVACVVVRGGQLLQGYAVKGVLIFVYIVLPTMWVGRGGGGGGGEGGDSMPAALI